MSGQDGSKKENNEMKAPFTFTRTKKESGRLGGSMLRLPTKDLTLGGAKKKVFVPKIKSKKVKKEAKTKYESSSINMPSFTLQMKGKQVQKNYKKEKREVFRGASIFEAGSIAQPTRTASTPTVNFDLNKMKKMFASKKFKSNKPSAFTKAFRTVEDIKSGTSINLIDEDSDEEVDGFLNMTDNDILASIVSDAGAVDETLENNPDFTPLNVHNQHVELGNEMCEDVHNTKIDTQALFQAQDPNQLFIIDMPRRLPFSDHPVPPPSVKQEPGVKPKALEVVEPVTVAAEAENKEPNSTTYKEGYLGKILICKSGKCLLKIGNVCYDINDSMHSEFFEEIVTMTHSTQRKGAPGEFTHVGQATTTLKTMTTIKI